MPRTYPNRDLDFMTNEQRLQAERAGVFVPPRAGFPIGFPRDASFVRPDYYSQRNAMIEQGLVTQPAYQAVGGAEKQGADQELSREYNRILAERMANEAMNRQQQAEQGRQLVNPMPSRLTTKDRQQYIDQHPLSEATEGPPTAISAGNRAVEAAMARDNAGGGAAPTPAETRAHLESIGQPVPADVLAATGGPGEAQAPAFVGQLRSSATELAGMTTKQEYDDMIQRLSAGSAPEQVAALKEAAPKYLTQLNPRLGAQVADQKLIEAKNEDVLAGWYRAQVDSKTTKSNAELSKQVLDTPELKSRFALEVGEITGPGGMALPLNPEIRDVLSLKISKDQENVSFIDPNTGAASTVGAAINKAQQAILASSGMSREARGAVRAQAIMDANAALDSVKIKLNDTKRMIDSGAIQSIVGIVQQSNEPQKIRGMAFQEVKNRIGSDNLVQSYAPVIQGVNVDAAKLLPSTKLMEGVETAGEGIGGEILYKADAGYELPALAGQVIIDLNATINKDKPMSAVEMQTAMGNSIAKVLANNNKHINAFSKDSGKRVITDLESIVKQRLGEQWKQTSERADNEMMVNRVLPMVSSFIDDSMVINKWTPDKAEFEFASIANLLSDSSQVSKDFIQQLDINGNKIIDRPEEYAAAWMVKKYGAGIIGIAKQLADGSFKFAGNKEQTQQLYDTFSSLVGQISGGMAESAIKTGKKVAEEWRAVPTSIADIFKAGTQLSSQLSDNMKAEKFISDGIPQVDLRNPKANMVERNNKQYWYATDKMAVLANTLDDEGLAAFNNTIGQREDIYGWTNDVNTRRGIVSAMSGRTQDLTEGRDSLYSNEWAAEKSVADIANEKAADKIRQGGKDVKTTKFVYPKGLEDIYANDPKLKALRDFGALRRATREDTSGKLIDLADVMATERYRAMESAVIDAGIQEIRRNMFLKTSSDIAYKLADAYEGLDLAEPGMPGYGKVKDLADVVSRVSRMVYNDEFTSDQLIELRDQYKLQSKIASKSKGDRARQKLNFGGPIGNETLEGYERSADEIVAAIDDKLSEGQVKAVDMVNEVTAQKATDIILKTMIPVDLYGIRKKLQESGIVKNVMMGSDIVEANIALKTGRVGKLLGTKIVDAAKQVGLNISDEINRITGAQ